VEITVDFFCCNAKFMNMNGELDQAIEILRQKISAKEDEVNKLKRVVNGLCADDNRPPLYPNVSSDSVTASQLRSDLFYGQTMAGAARQFLEMRKSSGQGAASVEAIYQALKTGGYSFDTKNEENAKTGVRISLRKNSGTFHRLPNGEYGLCAWYGVKGKNEDTPPVHKRSKQRKRTTSSKLNREKGKPHADSAQNANGGANDAQRAGHGVATSTGVITVGDFEDFVRVKPRRMKDIVGHFHVDQSIIAKFLQEPTSKVCRAGIGWLKIKE